MTSHGEDAARAVIFERAREQCLAASKKRRCNGIACKTVKQLAVKRERERLGVVNKQPPRGALQTVAGVVRAHDELTPVFSGAVR